MDADKTELLREQFNKWVESRTNTLFSPGAASSDFYFAIWLAGHDAALSAQPAEPKQAAPYKEPDCVCAINRWRFAAGNMLHRCPVHPCDPAAPPAAEPKKQEPALPSWWDLFIRNVCEIPGRFSPNDEPDAIVATPTELENCALNAIEQQDAQ